MPQGVTTARGQADPARFAVYRNNVFVGLTKALAKRFPVVERLVGEEFFAGMARVYAGLEKPASPLLFEYGDGFPEFIEQFEPAQRPGLSRRCGPHRSSMDKSLPCRGRRARRPGELAVLAPANLPGRGSIAHPASSLISSPIPIGSIWAAHQGGAVEPVRVSRPETVLVTRPAMDVSVHHPSGRGRSVCASPVCRRDTWRLPNAPARLDPGFDFGAAVVGLVSLGAFGAMEQRTI